MAVRSTPASSSRCESCRARSALKLKKTAESPGWSRGLPLITVGSMNPPDTPPPVPSPETHRAVRAFCPFPAAVAVHGVVAAADGCDAVGGQLREVGDRRV